MQLIWQNTDLQPSHDFSLIRQQERLATAADRTAYQVVGAKVVQKTSPVLADKAHMAALGQIKADSLGLGQGICLQGGQIERAHVVSLVTAAPHVGQRTAMSDFPCVGAVNSYLDNTFRLVRCSSRHLGGVTAEREAVGLNSIKGSHHDSHG